MIMRVVTENAMIRRYILVTTASVVAFVCTAKHKHSHFGNLKLFVADDGSIVCLPDWLRPQAQSLQP